MADASGGREAVAVAVAAGVAPPPFQVRGGCGGGRERRRESRRLGPVLGMRRFNGA